MIDQLWYSSGSQQTRNLNWFCHFFHLKHCDGSRRVREFAWRRRKVINKLPRKYSSPAGLPYTLWETLDVRQLIIHRLLAASLWFCSVRRWNPAQATICQAMGELFWKPQEQNINWITSVGCPNIVSYPGRQKKPPHWGIFCRLSGEEVIIFLFQPPLSGLH